MKKKIFAYLIMMLPALLLTSCLKDQDDVFDKSASIRSAEYLVNAQNVLMSAENGWVMNYYPDNQQKYGGYSYVLKFDKKNVMAYFVDGDTKTETIEGTTVEVPVPVTSTYLLNNEDGPVISFDTYNKYLHHFATPSASAYQAMGGDFIFIILNISDDQNTITLKGNRSGNIVKLYRNTMEPAKYISECKTITESQLYETFSKDDVLLELDLDAQQASVSAGDVTQQCGFVMTNKGIRLYQPISAGGRVFDTFTYDAKNNTYTADCDPSLVLEGSLPDGWQSYEDLAGTYKVGASTITVKTNGDGETYSITGFVNGVTGTITASYKFTKGSFVLSPQYAGMYGSSYYIWLLAYSSTDGLSWDTDIQFKGKNSATTPLKITFSASGWQTIWAGAFEADPPTGDSYAGYLQQYTDPLVFERVE